jgi:hypothetical protein
MLPTFRRSVRTAMAVGLVACVTLAACGDDDDDPGDTTESTTPGGDGGAAAGAGATTTTVADEGEGAEGEGCAAAGDGVPEGAGTAESVDVDGDGQADTVWMTGMVGGAERSFGITTASGATFSSPFSSASPIAASVMAFTPHGDGELPAYAIVSDGRGAYLYLIDDCAITPVQNVDGEQYTFDLQNLRGNGTGVGCVDLDEDGTRDLVGLLGVPSEGGSTVITRTIIELDGDQATNGESDGPTTSHDEAANESAMTISCGDLTIADNGAHEPEG